MAIDGVDTLYGGGRFVDTGSYARKQGEPSAKSKLDEVVRTHLQREPPRDRKSVV